MKVFVTGGSGFVGRRMIEMLQTYGYEVKALARSTHSANQIAMLGAEVVRGDILDHSAMIEGMRDCEVVFHIAGYLKMWGLYRTFYEVNVLGTERALAAAQAAGVERFLQMGASASVMNQKPIRDVDEHAPLQQPSFSPYIATKSLAEQRVIAANAPGFRTSVVRPSWVWGFGDHVVPQLAALARRNQFIWINHGNYPYVTTHVDNACHGMILAAQRSSGGQAYFLADEDVVQFREWVTRLLAIQGLQPGARSIPYRWAWMIATLMEIFWSSTRRKDAPPLSRTSVRLIGQGFTFRDDKARTELGYAPIVTREAGLAKLAHSA
jgi:nucleoside-diphosphate-sugar epimerase